LAVVQEAVMQILAVALVLLEAVAAVVARQLNGLLALHQEIP
jgi:hypothetical protein